MAKKSAAIAFFIMILFCLSAISEVRYSITLSSTYVKLAPGGTQRVSASVTPRNLVTHTFTWESENEYVATVSSNGTIKAHAAGSTRVYVTLETGDKKYVTVAVTGNPVRSLSIIDSDIQLEVGEAAQLEYEIDQTADDQRVKWSSSDVSVATVSSTGLVKAVSGGTATITLTAVNGMTATAEVYVPSDVQRIEIEPAEIYVGVGKSAVAEAYIYPGNARNRELKWISSDETIAIVDNDGFVTGIAPGKCMIKALTVNGVYALANVYADYYPDSINISQDIVVLSKTNKNAALNVEYYPPESAGSALNWESSDTAVVTVKNGNVSAVGYGSATVTATSVNGAKASCRVIVSEQPSSVSFESSSYSLQYGGNPVRTAVRFTPDESYEAGAVYTVDNPDIASVGADGTLIPNNPGRCTLTVSYPSGISASATVTVIENVTALILQEEHIYINAGMIQPLKVYSNSGNEYLQPLNAASDAPDVAVYSGGYIIAKSEGKALITLRSVTGGLSCSLAVTVYPANVSAMYTVALTFDNGPDRYTPEILGILNDYDVKATFFMLGMSVEKYPQYATLFVSTSHELGNHTYSNISMNSEPVSRVATQLEQTDKLIQNTAGRRPTLLRAPDARLSASLVDSFLDTRVYVARGIDAGDADSGSSPEEICRRLTDACYDTAILTLHDCGENTAEALRLLIPELIKRGYRFVTISELIEITGSTARVFNTAR